MTVEDTSDNPIAQWLSATAPDSAVRPDDEFTVRRLMKQTLAAYRDLLADPEWLAAADAEMAALEAAGKALENGIAAVRRGDLQLAEWQLLVAASAGFDAGAPYLTALYRHQGRTELARSWDALTQQEGLPPCELVLPVPATQSRHG